MTDIEEKLIRYKEFLDKHKGESENEKNNDILRALRKLSGLPVSLKHLQVTGIGKTVNSYRKRTGDVGRNVKELISKWKSLVPEQNESSIIPNERKIKSSSKYHQTSSTRSPVSSTYVGDGSERSNLVESIKSSSGKYDDVDDPKKKCKTIDTNNSVDSSRPKSEQKRKIKKDDDKKKSSKYTSKESSVKAPKKDTDAKDEVTETLTFDDLNTFDSALVKKFLKRKKNISSEATANDSVKSGASNTHSGKQKSARQTAQYSNTEKDRHEKFATSSDTQRTGSMKSSSLHVESDLDQVNMKKDRKGKKRKKSTESEAPLSKQTKMMEADIPKVPVPSPSVIPFTHNKPDKSVDNSAQDIKDTLVGLKRHAKTQVYSGRKTAALSVVPTLFDACMCVLKENIDCLEDVGGVPCDILMPVLEKCTSTQLFSLEDYNPHFVGETEALWERHSRKDFKSAALGEFESWRELYLREHDAREERFKRLTASISDTAAKASTGRQTKLAYVDSTAKPPRHVKRAQMKYGTSNSCSPKETGSYRGASAKITNLPKYSEKIRKTVAPMMAKSLRMAKSARR